MNRWTVEVEAILLFDNADLVRRLKKNNVRLKKNKLFKLVK